MGGKIRTHLLHQCTQALISSAIVCGVPTNCWRAVTLIKAATEAATS